MTRFGNTVLILILVIVAGAVYFTFRVAKDADVSDGKAITSFEECANAGYPVMESYPRQCRVPDGELFVETVPNPVPPVPAPVVKAGCYVGGCSSQICSDQPGAVSSCEFRPEYACYQSGTCERQPNGKCGWTQTAELKACLQNPPAI